MKCAAKTKRMLRELVPNVTARGRDSSVGIATCYEMDGLGIESQWWARLSANVQPSPGVHPTSCKMNTESFP